MGDRELQEALSDGEVDLVMGSSHFLKLKWPYHSVVYGETELALLSRWDEPIFRLDEISNREVGVISGSVAEDIFKRSKPFSKAKLVEFQNTDSMFLSLLNGRIDAIFHEMQNARFLRTKYGQEYLYIKRFPHSNIPLYFYSGKDKGALVKEIDEGIVDVFKGDEGKRITNKWFPEMSVRFPISSETGGNLKYFPFLSLLLILFILLYLIYRERLNRRTLLRVSESSAKALITVVELKDTKSRGHAFRVAKYSKMMAKRMDLPTREIYLAGLLHDVGKIALPDTILEKPTSLSNEEWEIVKKHPELGYLIVKTIEPLKEVAPWIRWHHERWDGSGYPDGLKGEEIPVEAQIISVADAFDSMTKRPYRDPVLTEEEALQKITQKSGVYWSPKVVEVAVSTLHIIEDEENIPLFGMIDRLRRSPYSLEKFFVLYEIAEEIRLLSDLDIFLKRILRILRDFMGDKYKYMLFLLEENKELRVASSLGYEKDIVGKILPPEKGLPYWAVRYRDSLISVDTREDPRFYPLSKEEVGSEITVPLVVGDRVVGALDVTSPAEDAFRKNHLEFLEMVSSAVSGAIEAARLYAKLQKLAFYDPLTGVHTFHHLSDTFNTLREKWLNDGKRVSIVFVDTDGLKTINDKYGHLVGDEILKTFARKLKNAIEGKGMIGRYGGDEFVILLPGMEVERANRIVKELKDEIDRTTIKVDDRDIPLIKFSYGISEFPKDGVELELLIKRADERMYRDKRKKR